MPPMLEGYCTCSLSMITGGAEAQRQEALDGSHSELPSARDTDPALTHAARMSWYRVVSASLISLRSGKVGR